MQNRINVAGNSTLNNSVSSSSFGTEMKPILPQQQQLQPPGTLVPGSILKVNGNSVIIQQFFAEGGFAHVYLVQVFGNISLICCLKRITCPDQNSLTSLIQEAQFHRQLSGHEAIVTLLDFAYAPLPGNGGYEMLILMEYCAGGPLVNYLNNRLDTRPSNDEILAIFYHICSAVSYMHSFSPPIAHRDLKIENVLLNNGVFKVCDFGSCTTANTQPNINLSIHEIRKLEDDISRLTTLQYRAPELCDLYQKKGINEKVDIWALGILLYKLCYYTTPFEQGKMAILNGVLTFPHLPPYSSAIKSLIAALLEREPAARPDIWQVFKHVCMLRNVPYQLSNHPRPISFNTSVPIMDLPSQNLQQMGLPFRSVTPNEYLVDLSSPNQNITPMRRGRPQIGTNTDLRQNDIFQNQAVKQTETDFVQTQPFSLTSNGPISDSASFNQNSWQNPFVPSSSLVPPPKPPRRRG